MYTVVTGAAGFIGSNLVKALNARGERDIIAVDDLADGDKFRNLVDCDIADYFDKDEFVTRLGNGDLDDDIAVISDDKTTAGSVVTVAGTVRLDKDFGGGYRYAVIIEDAKLR